MSSQLRILLVAPVHDRIAFARQRRKGIRDAFPRAQHQHAWVRALRSLGHIVEVFRYTDRITDRFVMPILERLPSEAQHGLLKLSTNAAAAAEPFYRFIPTGLYVNRMLLQRAAAFQPDIVLVSGGTHLIFPETVRELAKTSRTALLFGVAPVIMAARSERFGVHYYDAVFCNDPTHVAQWLMLGAKRAESLPISSFDNETLQRVSFTEEQRRELSCRVAFVGTIAPDFYYRKRRQLLERLAPLNLALWSPDEKEVLGNSVLAPTYRGRARGADMAAIYQLAEIVINDHGQSQPGGGNIRLFEAAGLGAFQIADACDPEWFTDGKEIVLFGNLDDAATKVSYYLDHPEERHRIAQAARGRTLREHTYVHHFGRLVEYLLAVKK